MSFLWAWVTIPWWSITVSSNNPGNNWAFSCCSGWERRRRWDREGRRQRSSDLWCLDNQHHRNLSNLSWEYNSYSSASVNIFGLLLSSLPHTRVQPYSRSKFSSVVLRFTIFLVLIFLSFSYALASLFFYISVRIIFYSWEFENMNDSCTKSVVLKVWGALRSFQGVHEVTTTFIIFSICGFFFFHSHSLLNIKWSFLEGTWCVTLQ